MPVRIVFDDPSMRVHVCPDHLKDYVITDIRVRYGVEVKEIHEVEQIHMDPGGMAFINPELIQFEIQGVKFQCNAEHLINVQETLRRHYRVVDSPDGQLARVYLWTDLLVIPATYLWAMQNYLEFNKEKGIEKANEIVAVLAEANARIAEESPKLPENVVPLFEDDENIH